MPVVEPVDACKGPALGWELCPWVLTGGCAEPYYILHQKMKAEGRVDVGEDLGAELAELMALLDKVFLTEKRENADELLPGFDIWVKDILKHWSPQDCYCRQAPTVGRLSDPEKQRLRELWKKRCVLSELAEDKRSA